MADMIIEGLHVKNMRLFTELNIKFNEKFNVLAGLSGCGKTSALVCIAQCLSGNFDYSRFGEDAELWVDVLKDGEAYRIGLGAGSFGAAEYRRVNIKEWVPPPVDGQQRIPLSAYQANELQSIPLFIGTRRKFAYYYAQIIQPEKQRDEALAEYISRSVLSLCGEYETSIKQWLISRDFTIEKEWMALEKQNWERFITCLPKIAPPESHFSYIKTGRDFEPVFSVYGKECYLEELSAGFQSVLFLVMDIFIWIESLMEGDRRLAVNAKGTVLIDDLDIHLDPEWQRAILQALIDLFPNLQFIVTANSPHLLASAGPGEVIVMPKNHSRPVYNLLPEERSFAGCPAEDDE